MAPTAIIVTSSAIPGDGQTPGTGDDHQAAFAASLSAAGGRPSGSKNTSEKPIDRSADDQEKKDSGKGESDKGEVILETEAGDVVLETETGDLILETEAGDVVLETETIILAGDDLLENLSADTLLGSATVGETADGSFGVRGTVPGTQDARLQVGEILSFNVPPNDGYVIGGQVTFSDLFDNANTCEGALIIAYDTESKEIACYNVQGTATGTATVGIDVPFARLDFRASDNGSWNIGSNSNFGLSNIRLDIVAEPAPENGEVGYSGMGSKFLLNFGQFNKLTFQQSRFAVCKTPTLQSLQHIGSNDKQAEDRHLEHARNHTDHDLAAGRVDRGINEKP